MEMMTMEPNIWRENYPIRSYEVDCGGKLSIISVFNFMQEAASKHAAALGVSIQQLLKEDFTWLLSRLKIKVNTYPLWTDLLTVYTWPSGTHRLFALRDFHIMDQNQISVGAALSAWLVIDTIKRRPVRISRFVDRLKPIEGDHILPDPLDKLPKVESYTDERIFRVRFRDLDINRHVNNASYVEWILESLPEYTQNKLRLSELEINFLAESFLQDQIVARCQAQDATRPVFQHALFREQDGQELVRARTVWQPIEEELVK